MPGAFRATGKSRIGSIGLTDTIKDAILSSARAHRKLHGALPAGVSAVTEAFPSKYLKAADLKDQQVRVVMDHVVLEDIGDDGMKPILYFQGKDKGLCLNKTNSNNIALIYGDDTDDWAGKELILYPTMVDYQGRSVPAIRVRVPQPKERQRDAVVVPSRMPNGNGAATRQPTRQELNDEIPF